MGYVPTNQEEREGIELQSWRQQKDWVQEHEERERAAQVVPYCD